MHLRLLSKVPVHLLVKAEEHERNGNHKIPLAEMLIRKIKLKFHTTRFADHFFNNLCCFVTLALY